MQNTSYPVSPEWAKQARVNAADYHAMYARSIEDPALFWAAQSRASITWFQPWEQVLQGTFNTYDVRWFIHGKLNACYNCVDRHLSTRSNQTALIWEGNDPSESQHITYAALYEKVCKLAHALKMQGIQKGDRVCIYLPMIPEIVIAMLACARIGAIHSVVFAGFSSDALKTRLLDAACKLIITADFGVRGDKFIPLKQNTDRALIDCMDVKRVIVVQRTGRSIAWDNTRDRWYHDVMAEPFVECSAEPMDAADPLFILYTSGSTGKPKGVVHSTGGYLVYVAVTHQMVFDCQEGDIYWCTADPGWITGHSYLVYGPLANGSTIVLFEGVPHHPTPARYWDIIDKYRVSVFYTSPTAIRALRLEGDDWVKQTSRKSLRLLGSVGEPINPDVWQWFYDVVGEGRCPIVNTWWQTETGGILLSPLPGATPLIPGSSGWPFLGIEPEVVDEQGQRTQDNQLGCLVIKQPWPGLMQTIYGDQQRFMDTYFKPMPGCYLTGDGAMRDEAGDVWIIGRNDDVIKVSGHRMGTEELESAFVSHPHVSEAAVVGIPHAIKGESIFAFVTTNKDVEPSPALKQALIQHVREKIGALATPDGIQWTTALPKTRSGKIMRRILRQIASNHMDNLGDLSTLADASVVQKIIEDKCSYDMAQQLEQDAGDGVSNP